MSNPVARPLTQFEKFQLLDIAQRELDKVKTAIMSDSDSVKIITIATGLRKGPPEAPSQIHTLRLEWTRI